MNHILRFQYTNHRGHTSIRQVIDPRLYFGRTIYYPEDQWLLAAFDLDRNAQRDFAVKHIVFQVPE